MSGSYFVTFYGVHKCFINRKTKDDNDDGSIKMVLSNRKTTVFFLNNRVVRTIFVE